MLGEIAVKTDKGEVTVKEMKSEAGLWKIVLRKDEEEKKPEEGTLERNEKKEIVKAWMITYVDVILTVAKG